MFRFYNGMQTVSIGKSSQLFPQLPGERAAPASGS